MACKSAQEKIGWMFDANHLVKEEGVLFIPKF